MNGPRRGRLTVGRGGLQKYITSKVRQMIDQQFHWGHTVRSAAIRVLHLLIWTILIAGLFAMIMKFVNVQLNVMDRDEGVLEFWVLYMNYAKAHVIVSVPFAFVVSQICQPITSARMWTSFLFTVLLSSWLGMFSIAIGWAMFSWPALSGLLLIVIGLIVSIVASVFVPRLFGSLRKKPFDSGAGT